MRSSGELLVVLGVVLHDALYRFRVVQVTGTATLEANLAQQLSGIAYEPLFQVFYTSTRLMTHWTGADPLGF